MSPILSVQTRAGREDDLAGVDPWEVLFAHLQWAARPYPWRPPTDVFETEDALVVRLEVAGMRPEDFQITLEDRTLVIRGVRHEPEAVRAYQQMEIRFGAFEVIVVLATPVQSEEVAADYREGFLTVRLPKVLPVHVSVSDANG